MGNPAATQSRMNGGERPEAAQGWSGDAMRKSILDRRRFADRRIRVGKIQACFASLPEDRDYAREFGSSDDESVERRPGARHDPRG